MASCLRPTPWTVHEPLANYAQSLVHGVEPASRAELRKDAAFPLAHAVVGRCQVPGAILVRQVLQMR